MLTSTLRHSALRFLAASRPLARAAARGTLSSTRLFSSTANAHHQYQHQHQHQQQQNGANRTLLASLAGASSFAGLVAALAYVNSDSNAIQLDSGATSYTAEDSIQVESSINNFPTTIVSSQNGSTKFSLLGYGVRKVTFLNFKVYGLGLYIADEDLSKIPQVLNSTYLSQVYIDKYNKNLSHSENLLLALKDPKASEVLVNSLLDADIKFVVRIVPLRDTDFNHLRDGFVKSCIRNNYVKSQYPEQLNNGVDEIRAIFKKHRSKCPKNHVFLVETDSNGKVTFFYENYGTKPEKGELKSVLNLGTVQESIISKALLLNYFAGSKPISEDARKTSISEIARLV